MGGSAKQSQATSSVVDSYNQTTSNYNASTNTNAGNRTLQFGDNVDNSVKTDSSTRQFIRNVTNTTNIEGNTGSAADFTALAALAHKSIAATNAGGAEPALTGTGTRLLSDWSWARKKWLYLGAAGAVLLALLLLKRKR